MKQNNIFGKYNDVLNKHDAERSNKLADLVISAGLVLSSLFTLLYMVVAFGGALVGWSWPPAVAYALGLLLGVAAVVPGEGAIFIWRSKLNNDTAINSLQIGVAWLAGLASAISASVTTVSFFAFLLPALMPVWYDPAMANSVNVFNLFASWVVLLIALFIYSGASNNAAHNRQYARAVGLVQRGRNEMMIGIAGSIQDRAAQMIADMDAADGFAHDALETVAGLMDLDNGRKNDISRLAGGDGRPEATAKKRPPAPAYNGAPAKNEDDRADF